MSETFRINKSFVDKTAFVESGQTIYRDSDLIGFALRVTAKSKTYIVERRKDTKLVRMVVGKHTDIAAAEARTKAETYLAQIGAGEDPRKPKKMIHLIPTLEVAFEEYKNDHQGENRLKPKTISSYNKSMDCYLSKWKKLKLSEISKQDVADKHLEISEISPAQANAAMRLVRAIFNWAMHFYTDEKEVSLIAINPVLVLKQKKRWNRIKPRTDHLDEDQIGPFFRSLVNYRSEDSHRAMGYSNNARDLYIVIMLTGIRLDEGQTLGWVDVNVEKGLLIFRDTKNGDDLHLGDFLHAVLEKRFPLRSNEWVFPSRQKPKSHIVNMRASLTNLNKAAGTDIDSHDLRRTYASITNRLAYGLATIKRLLNHRESTNQGETTLTYIQVSRKEFKRAMNDIEDTIFEAAGLNKADIIARLKASASGGFL
jgi:integrase